MRNYKFRHGNCILLLRSHNSIEHVIKNKKLM